MEDRKLLYSLMEGVLIIYNEHNRVNNYTRHLLEAEEVATGAFTLPWRLIFLLLSIWFLTILTWVAMSVHLGKVNMQQTPGGDAFASRSMLRHRKNPFAPNYHTHFHCNCDRHQPDNQRMDQVSNEDLFRDLNSNHLEHDMFEVHEQPRGTTSKSSQHSDSAAELANMQLGPSHLGEAAYEVAV